MDHGRFKFMLLEYIRNKRKPIIILSNMDILKITGGIPGDNILNFSGMFGIIFYIKIPFTDKWVFINTIL